MARSVADLQQAARVLGPATPKGASAGGQSRLAAQLDVVATLIEMGVPTRVYSVSLGGFDTHSDERGTQQRLLAELDGALTAFQARLRNSERGAQVVTAVYSEFGRRVVANASDGTDHGTAGPVFVMGRGVSGGFHGAEPSLTDLDQGDLRAGVDFPRRLLLAAAARARRRAGRGPGRMVGTGRGSDHLTVRPEVTASPSATLQGSEVSHDLGQGQPGRRLEGGDRGRSREWPSG